MPDRWLTEDERRALERRERWAGAVRCCGVALVIIVGFGGVIALGPLLLQVAR